MSSLDRLLDLQDHDVRIDQFVHRRANLPERAQLAARRTELRRLDAAAKPLADERARAAREQQRLESNATALATKAAAEDKRLYSGTVTSPRELQSIQEEISSLRRRQSDLEDQALAVLDEVEAFDAQLAELAAQRAGVENAAAALSESIAKSEAEIDGELAGCRAEREAIAAELGPQIVGPYDSLRSRFGGVAVAKLEGGMCRGCHLKLSSVDLDRILHLPADAVVHCEQCGRILVR